MNESTPDAPKPATEPALPPPPPAAVAKGSMPLKTASPYRAMEKPVSFWNVCETLLKQPGSIVFEMREGRSRNALVSLALVAVLCFAAYGLTVGTFSLGHQLWAAPVKLVVGILLSAAVCFPSLFIFSCLSGVDCRVRETGGMLLGMMALCGLLLVGFAPVSWIFSQSTSSVNFMGFMHLVIWTVALVYGLRFMGRAFSMMHGKRSLHLPVWAVIFVLVTLQMTTTLRPILGRSDKLVQTEKKFFLTHWINSLDREMSDTQDQQTPTATP